MKLKHLYIAIFLPVILSACEGFRDDYKRVPTETDGYKPVYFDTAIGIKQLIFSSAPQSVKNPGKIYLYQNYLFVGEPEFGVHVFDNTDPANPIPFCFINIPYNYDIAIKDTVLYADTYAGLVTIGISKLPQITFLQYIKTSSLLPPFPTDPTDPFFRNAGTIYFECIDPTKGIVVGWKLAKLKNPKCYQ